MGDCLRFQGQIKCRRSRSLPQKRPIVHATKMHICDIFAIIASYRPKSRLNRVGCAKSRLKKRHLRDRPPTGSAEASRPRIRSFLHLPCERARRPLSQGAGTLLGRGQSPHQLVPDTPCHRSRRSGDSRWLDDHRALSSLEAIASLGKGLL